MLSGGRRRRRTDVSWATVVLWSAALGLAVVILGELLLRVV
jgi:hypothetical protein